MKSRATDKVSGYFIITAIVALLAGICFGLIAGLQYLLPDFLKSTLSFRHTRPLHVSLITTWIFGAATGLIYYILGRDDRKFRLTGWMSVAHFVLFLSATAGMMISYLSGQFSGREYLEYTPWLAFPMMLAWLLFLGNFLRAVWQYKGRWPVYLWMWTTGIVFFIVTYAESFLWLLPHFGENIVRDTTVQWKALGAMVGSWNMLIYGSAFYLMEKVSGDRTVSRKPLTFFFYFLGLTNLMFNWGHHTYIVPAASYVKTIAFVISMTELLILGNIILNWRKSLSAAKKHSNSLIYRFLTAADIWIFINLILAITISVPAINLYTHGTHITVAHAMGATIGINCMLLFGGIYYVLGGREAKLNRTANSGLILTNISLAFFWTSLLSAGIYKAISMQPGITTNFSQVMTKLEPVFRIFFFSGLFLLAGILCVLIPVLRMAVRGRPRSSIHRMQVEEFTDAKGEPA